MKRHILKLSGIFSVILACAFITACPGEPEPELPPEPETPVYDTVTFQLDSNHCDSVDASEFYPGASLSVSYADENETPAAKIYYSLSEELTPENYKTLLAAENTSVKLYESAIALAPTHNHEKVSISVIAENAAGEVKAVDSKSFYCLPTYVPYSTEKTYSVKGGLQDIKEIFERQIANGKDVINVDLSGVGEACGYVVMICDKDDNDYIIVEDADTAVQLYGNIEATEHYLGEFVIFTPKTGEYYNNNYEVKVFDNLQIVDRAATDYIYYKNINGLKDFSGLEDGYKLCGMITDENEDSSIAETPYAYINKKYTEKRAVFGFISYNMYENYTYLNVLEDRAPFVITEEESNLKAGVEKVYVSKTALKAGEKLEVKCVTPEADIYYTLKDNDSESEFKKYTGEIELETGIYNLRAYSAKNGTKTAVKSFVIVSMDGVNSENVKFVDYGLTNATDLTKLTGEKALKTSSGATAFEFIQGEGYVPKYYKSGTAARLYAKNSIKLDSKRTITKAVFEFRFPYEPIEPGDDSESEDSAAARFVPDSGVYNYKTFTWSGEAKSITFETDSPVRITSITLIYKEVDLLTAVPEFHYGEKTALNGEAYLVNAGTEIVLNPPENLEAEIYYSTGTPITYINAKEAGVKYVDPVEINETTTIYAVMFTGSGLDERSSEAVWATFAVETGKTYANRVESIQDGDKIFIFETAHDVYLSTETSSSYCNGKNCVSYNENELLRIDEGMQELNVIKTLAGQYQFWFMDGDVKKFLVSEPNATSVYLGYNSETVINEIDYSLWSLEKLEGSDYDEYILCSADGKKYLVYSEGTFKAYHVERDRAVTVDNYHMSFYKLTGGSSE